MIQHIFSIYDNKARAFISPFFFATTDMAVRTFSSCANESGHMFCKHPEDFSLFHIGEFEDNTGELTGYANSINLGLAAAYQISN